MTIEYALKLNKHEVFEIRWSENGRSKKKSTHCREYRAALRYMQDWLDDKERQNDEGGWLWSEAYAIYYEEKVSKGRGAKSYRSWAAHLLPVFGDREITDIPQRLVDQYVTQRVREGVQASTAGQELKLVKTVIRYLYKTRRTAVDMTPYLSLPADPEPRERFLELEEIDAAKQEIERQQDGPRLSRVSRFFHIGIATGQRAEAIERLTWDRVDFNKGTIDFRIPGRHQTKTKKQQPRAVPISDDLMVVLRRAHAERQGDYVLDTPARIFYHFEKITKACGWDDVSPHTLRHTFASHAVMAGHSYAAVAAVLGNSAQVVERVYGHLSPDHLRSVVNSRPQSFRVVK